MTDHCIHVTPSAYSYPLLIKHLLHTPLVHAPEQEIVYRGQTRCSYRTLRDRIGRLTNALAALGVKRGDTVAMMDWDSHRYLECYFAVPMMGAVLQTVNIRLSPEQILYTLNHAEAKVVLAHADFLPIVKVIRDKLETVRKFIVIADGTAVDVGELKVEGEYEDLVTRASAVCDFPDFDENTRATTFYTIGTTGFPKGVYYSHRQLVLHTLGVMSAMASTSRSTGTMCTCRSRRCSMCTPRGFPVRRQGPGREAGLPGALPAGCVARLEAAAPAACRSVELSESTAWTRLNFSRCGSPSRVTCPLSFVPYTFLSESLTRASSPLPLVREE